MLNLIKFNIFWVYNHMIGTVLQTSSKIFNRTQPLPTKSFNVLVQPGRDQEIFNPV